MLHTEIVSAIISHGALVGFPLVHGQWLKAARVPTQKSRGVIGVSTANEHPTSDPHGWVRRAGCTAEVSNARLVVGDLRPVLSHSTGAPVLSCITFKRGRRCSGEQKAPSVIHPWRHGQKRRREDTWQGGKLNRTLAFHHR